MKNFDFEIIISVFLFLVAMVVIRWEYIKTNLGYYNNYYVSYYAQAVDRSGFGSIEVRSKAHLNYEFILSAKKFILDDLRKQGVNISDISIVNVIKLER